MRPNAGLPQDGRFRIKVIGKEVDLRVLRFCLPAYGEKIVISYLDKAALTGSIDQMGMEPRNARTNSRRRSTAAARDDSRDRSEPVPAKTTTLYSVLAGAKQPTV